MPIVQTSDTIVNLFDLKIVNLTSSVSPNPLIPTPVKYFWPFNMPDTMGILVFSNASSVTIDLFTGNIPISSNGNYQIYLIASQGTCIDTVVLELKAYHIPNLVTPNNDGYNDKWEVTKSPQLFDAGNL